MSGENTKIQGDHDECFIIIIFMSETHFEYWLLSLGLYNNCQLFKNCTSTVGTRDAFSIECKCLLWQYDISQRKYNVKNIFITLLPCQNIISFQCLTLYNGYRPRQISITIQYTFITRV